MKYALILPFLLIGCSSDHDDLPNKNQKGQYIYRKHNEKTLPQTNPERITRQKYPWELSKPTKKQEKREF